MNEDTFEKIIQMRKDRQQEISSMGPRPGWWRPLRRHEWDIQYERLNRLWQTKAMSLTMGLGPELEKAARWFIDFRRFDP